MEKSTKYGLFVRTVSSTGRAESGARSKAQFIAELEAEYPPSEGWRIVGTEFAGLITAEGYTVMLSLQKFVEDYPQVPQVEDSAEDA